MKRRKSLQREKIYQVVKESKTHPTVQWIYETLTQQGENFSVSNIYRNINILIEEGRVVRREFNDGAEHFDAILFNHYHFFCDSCSKIVDFSLPVQESLNLKANDIDGHRVDRHQVQFYGTCSKCKDQEE